MDGHNNQERKQKKELATKDEGRTAKPCQADDLPAELAEFVADHAE